MLCRLGRGLRWLRPQEDSLFFVNQEHEDRSVEAICPRLTEEGAPGERPSPGALVLLKRWRHENLLQQISQWGWPYLPDVHGAGMRDETRRCAGRGLPVDMRARPAWWKAGHPAGAVEGGGSWRDARDTDRAGMCRQPRQARGQSETQPGRRAEPQGPCLGLSGSGAHSC